MSGTNAPQRRWASPEQLVVRAAVRTALRDLPAGALVLVASSGGPDSSALASALAFHGPRHSLRVGAVVVDHGLQKWSGTVAAATGAWLEGLGMDPVEVVQVQVGGVGGPEGAARRARYDALAAVAESRGATAVLLGHTRDDQAETVLLGLARGSGARSLSGMAPVRGIYRRPLLALPRSIVRAAVEAGTPVVHDPHNSDPAYARSRLRVTALPVLEEQLGPGVAAALARSAELLRADADALDGWAAEAYERLGADPSVGLEVAGLAALPDAVRRRVLRLAAIGAGAPPGPLGAAHLAALDALVIDWHGQRSPGLPGGVRAVRRCGRLTMRLPAPPPAG